MSPNPWDFPWRSGGFTLPGAFTAMMFVIVLFGVLWVTPK